MFFLPQIAHPKTSCLQELCNLQFEVLTGTSLLDPVVPEKRGEKEMLWACEVYMFHWKCSENLTPKPNEIWFAFKFHSTLCIVGFDAKGLNFVVLHIPLWYAEHQTLGTNRQTANLLQLLHCVHGIMTFDCHLHNYLLMTRNGWRRSRWFKLTV